jgi:hypothetical protein
MIVLVNTIDVTAEKILLKSKAKKTISQFYFQILLIITKHMILHQS